jgi:hypothetical protein
MPAGLKRKVIRIKAEDSPNVRYALAEIAAGREPSGRVLVPGVKQYWEYISNRRDWDSHQQCVSLDADWYQGANLLWFPPDWLNLAEQAAEKLAPDRKAKCIGIDTAEGGDETSMAAVDDAGLIELRSKRTPNTAVIPGEALAFAREMGGVAPENILFDRGGGGYEHACVLRRMGYNVRTVGFGEAVVPPLKRKGNVTQLPTRIEQAEERYAYKSRRAEMHGILRRMLDPHYDEAGKPTRQVFAIPRKYVELRRQLTPIPMWYDDEGRLTLPPKQLRSDEKDKDSKLTIEKLLGCSPDQSDSLILAVFGLVSKATTYKAQAMV